MDERMQRIIDALRAEGYPVAEMAFSKEVAPPFFVYLREDSRGFAADDTVYLRGAAWAIELYTETMLPGAVELLLEGLLAAEGLYWECYRGYIESERLFESRYEMVL